MLLPLHEYEISNEYFEVWRAVIMLLLSAGENQQFDVAFEKAATDRIFNDSRCNREFCNGLP